MLLKELYTASNGQSLDLLLEELELLDEGLRSEFLKFMTTVQTVASSNNKKSSMNDGTIRQEYNKALAEFKEIYASTNSAAMKKFFDSAMSKFDIAISGVDLNRNNLSRLLTLRGLLTSNAVLSYFIKDTTSETAITALVTLLAPILIPALVAVLIAKNGKDMIGAAVKVGAGLSTFYKKASDTANQPPNQA